MIYDFILASASPRRKELLANILIEPKDILVSEINEDPKKNELPNEYVKRIAKEKAVYVFEKNSNRVVLSCDTIVAMGIRILQKPTDREDAKRKLKQLSGRSHKVISSVCMIRADGKLSQKTITSRVVFKNLSEIEIEEYLDTNEWCDKAGAYGIQGYASCFVKKIVGSYTNIVGLPIMETKNLLNSAIKQVIF